MKTNQYITGRVVRADGRASGLGYPTANLDVVADQVGIPDGVYAARADFCERTYEAALVVSRVFDKVEVHVLDFAGDLYGWEISVHPIQKVSEIEQCDSDMELKKKIRNDITLVRHILKSDEQGNTAHTA